MSSDKSQSQVGGTSAAGVAQIGTREGGLSAAQKRAAVDNASVQVRAKDDKGEALDAALTDSAFMAKTDGDLKNLSGNDLLDEMRYNPLTQAKSGTSWAQVSIAKAGLDQELDKLIEGAPIVEERQCHENIHHLLAAKPLSEMSPIQVKFLQQNLERLGLFSGKIDGDFSNPKMVVALDNMVHESKVLEDSINHNGGRKQFAKILEARGIELTPSKPEPSTQASAEFSRALRNQTPKMSEPSSEAKIMSMFKDNHNQMTSAPALLAQVFRPKDLTFSI